jgi:hypothetical protein
MLRLAEIVSRILLFNDPADMNLFSRWIRSVHFRSPALWLAAAGLVACALAWRWIDFAGSDAGPVRERLREMTVVYLPAVSGGEHWATNWASDAEFAGRAWKMGWLGLNEQWDARVVAAASAVLHAVAWALVLGLFARRPRGIWQYGFVALVGVAVLLMPRAGEFWTSAATAWSGWLVLLSILHLGMQAGGRASGLVWWLGWAVGVANVVGAKEGGAAALVLVGLSAWRLRERAARSGTAWLALGMNVLLCAVSAALWLRRGGGETDFLAHMRDVLSWPHGSVWAGAVILLPSFAWILRAKTATAEKSVAAENVLAAFAAWAVAQPLMLAMAGVQSGPAVWGVMGVCVLINAVCVAVLGSEMAGRRWTPAVFTLWALAAAHALLQTGVDRDDAAVFRENERWRLAWFAGDAEALAHEEGMDLAKARGLLDLKGNKGSQQWLPVSLRAPLPLQGESTDAEGAFRVAGVPPLEGEAEGLPALGTWAAGKVGRAGEFTSGKMVTTYPLLRLWVAGEGSGVAVRLRTESGREIAPLQEPRLQAKRWVRVNFEAPGEAFRVVARQEDARGWSAIGGPAETGELSWLVGKVVHAWSWLLAAAVTIVLVAMAAFVMKPERGEAAVSGSNNAGGFGRWLPWMAFAVYAWMVAHAMSPSAGGSDSSCYLNTARLFTEHRLTMPVREPAGISAKEFGEDVFIPLAFRQTVRAGEVTAVTAIGVPAMYAALAVFMPLAKAVPWVALANGLMGVLATRLVAGVFGLPRGWSWLAAGIVGLSPQFLFIGYQALSDGPSLAWATLAVYFAWRSRERMSMAWLAGAATAMAILVRPTNVLCVVPVLACLPLSWRGFLYWIGGGVPGGIFQAWYSWTVWGNPFTSGYGDVAEAFRMDYFVGNLAHYAWWLPVLLTPVVVLAPGVFFLRTVGGRVRLVLGLWAGIFLGFYAFFRHTDDAWWFLRFLLPAFPALAVSALLVLRWIFTDGPARGLSVAKRGRLAAVGVVCLLSFLFLNARAFQVFFWMRGDRVFERAGLWLKENAPPGSTVLSVHGGGTVIYYTDLPMVMYHHDFVRESPRFAEALAAGGKPVYALMFHFERPGGRPDFLGAWEEVASFNQGDARIWRWLGRAESGSSVERAK